MICATRDLKKRGSFASVKRASLFSGTVHFVDTTFAGVKVSDADVATAIKYATLAAPLISQYCSPYGANSLVVDPTPIPFAVDVSSFSDADLQGWANQIARALPLTDALVFLCPRAVNNTDAPVSQRILGYHGKASIAYSFVNLLGSGLTTDDEADLYALALSHEVAEMTVDPDADLSEPEVCDPCAGNCGVDYRNYFDSDDNWLSQTQSPVGYAFFVAAIATPDAVQSCPAAQGNCAYAPGMVPPPPPTNPFLAFLRAIIAFLKRLFP